LEAPGASDEWDDAASADALIGSDAFVESHLLHYALQLLFFPGLLELQIGDFRVQSSQSIFLRIKLMSVALDQGLLFRSTLQESTVSSWFPVTRAECSK
jgi:hypothetical protein